MTSGCVERRPFWPSIVGMAVVVVGLNLIGWGVLLGLVAPARFQLGDQGVFGVGLGVTAWLLGVRHAFDVDHIAAIDNTTRKLVGEGRPAHSTGFWFSLGHSTVVFGLTLLLAFGVHSLAGTLLDEGSGLRQAMTFIGSGVAGGFLIIIGLMNVAVLRGVLQVFRRVRAGEVDEAALEQHLHNRGFWARVFQGAIKTVSRPWNLYPVGLLMGLGFDTATQVALLVVAGGVAAFALPWWALLVLPVLFAAGMTLFDTLDGVFMAHAYRWAFLKPVRKVYYNLTVTLLSVVTALLVGGVVLAQLLADWWGIDGAVVGWLQALDLTNLGLVLVAIFAVVWLASVALWRFGRIEQRFDHS